MKNKVTVYLKMSDSVVLRVERYTPKKLASITQKPLFVLNGGPGSSNLSAALVPPQLFGDREVVFVGYRGIDSSPRLSDKNLNEAIKAHSAELNIDDLKSIAKAYEADLSVAQAQGIDVRAYSIFNVIDDIEEVRNQLSFESIDIFGISYGTRLAYLYAIKYAKSLHRIVMLGGNPPGHFYIDGHEVDSVLEKYDALWSKDKDARKVSKTLSTDVKIGINQKQSNWLWWNIDRGAVRIAAQALLFNPETASMILEALAKSAHGDNSGLAGLSFMSGQFYGSMNFLEFFLKGMVDYKPEFDAVAATEPSSFAIGSPLTRLSFGSAKFIDPARVIAIDPQGLALIGQKVDVPCLVLNGNLDASTPLPGVRNDLMPLLTNGQLLELEGYGHVDYMWRASDEAGRIIGAFLSGKVQAEMVKPQPARVEVNPKFSASTISGLATAGVGLLGAGVITTLIMLLAH